MFWNLLEKVENTARVILNFTIFSSCLMVKLMVDWIYYFRVLEDKYLPKSLE